jgi:aryl-alcohol dehydrogenase-like predicted oxidoreductase
MLSGCATQEGTTRFQSRFPEARDAGHFRRLGDLWVSSIGLGTYLGEPTDEVDGAYEAAVLEALRRGCNLFDTAINYRYQRSERALGRALASAFEQGLAMRDEVVVCTKGGFLPFDEESPEDPVAYFRERYQESGLVGSRDLAQGCHALNVDFLADQLARSRRNLGLETVDVYYLHNPETQFAAVEQNELLDRLRGAFVFLEERCGLGQIGSCGIATWDGLRLPPGSGISLRLESVAGLAGPNFRAVQAPVNLAMPEALASPSQELEEVAVPLLVATRALGLSLFSSASIAQGGLARLPGEISEALPGLETDAQRALQFTRSLPGVTSALVGMKSKAHVRENLGLAEIPAATIEAIQQIFI